MKTMEIIANSHHELHMKIVSYQKFGGIDVLQINEVPKPTASVKQVSVKVKAVSINPLDWKIRKGEMKLLAGSKFPKRIGIDFAGVIDAVGEEVNNFIVGDEVFGVVNPMKEGALGEFVLVPVTSVWKKPTKINFAQAASIPVAGAGAYQAIEEIGLVSAVSEVLINGATGGMGMFALQLAKQRGAQVTAVTNSDGISFARKWGADQTSDYTEENILHSGKTFDLIFDLSGKMPFEKARKILKNKAVFIDPTPKLIDLVSTKLTGLFTSRKHATLFADPNETAITALLAAIDKGLEIEVSRVFLLSEFREAYQFAEKGGFIGKIAIETEGQSPNNNLKT
jgi:NADPH:quinone reductase-like Zn-dependent oxidoreductase